MIEVYHQGLFGVWKECSQGDDNKHVATHVVIQKEEYADLQQQIADLKWQHRKERGEAEQKLKHQQADYERKIQKIKKELEDDVAYWKNKAAEYQDLNSNLLRIAKERANAKRGLKPKKQHDGYLPVTTGSYFERFRTGKDIIERLAYKTVIQTPFEMNIELKNVLLLLDCDAPDSCLLVWFDEVAYFGSNEADEAFKPKYSNKNYCFRWNLKLNISKGFWEVELFHTEPFIFGNYDN